MESDSQRPENMYTEQQKIVLACNVGVLDDLGVTHVRLLKCPECGMPCLCESWHSSFVCGMCGAGLFQANETGEVTHIGDPDDVDG